MKTHSLTRTLIVGVLLAELVCAVVFSALALAHEMNGRQRAFDVMLQGRADSVLGAIQDAEDPADNVIVDETELPLPKEDAYEVTMASGHVAGRSPGISGAMFDALASHHSNGYFNFKAEGRTYRALRQPGIRVIDRDEEHGGIRRPVTIVYAAPTAHLWHEAVEAVRFYVIASSLLLLITGIAITWFLRRSMSPLRELAVRAERVSVASWEFNAPAGVRETRELEPIAASIQKLLTGLRGSFERQRQFTGDAAHELKTSIAVLKSSLQLVLMRPRTASEYRESIEGLVIDTQRMEDLTERMLTLARVEQSPPGPCRVSDISITLSMVVERLKPATTLRQVSIELLESPGLSDLPEKSSRPVTIDPHDADLLCSNLLMNAVQHSAPGMAVAIAVRDVGDSVELLIRDEGKGIPPEALPHIFERFYRADQSRSRANGGAGLGLAICKAIADRCGATISVSSELGRGTTVKVALPVRVEKRDSAMEPTP